MDISKLGTDRIQQDRANEAQQANNKKTQVEKRDSQNVGESARTSDSAKVQWSSQAKLANEVLSNAKASSGVRADRVAALKAAIADGSYKVDSKALADKMIATSLEDDILTRG
ncbi:flagellar biosynthesis anti-sigma factor FlgM [bacterium]|nr:flagellar biosynthesis anti-sigma factor FlgM [bacterium]